MSRAEYSLPMDRLRVWFDDRLSDADYARARSCRLVFWHGQKCFAGKWNPEAEDFILSFGIEIVANDEPDNVEARVDRFSGYAESAEKSAEYTKAHLDAGKATTERKKVAATNSLEASADKARHWNDRIAGAIRHAAMKESPGVIARRIEGIETSIRKFTRGKTPHPTVKSVSSGQTWMADNHYMSNERLASHAVWADRWIAHLENVLLYEQANLAATGSIQADMAMPGGVTIEKDGAVMYGNRWLLVTKVNPKSIEIYDRSSMGLKWRQIFRTEIKDIASKERVDSGELGYIAKPDPVEATPKGPTKTRAGAIPEKFGAAMIYPGFSKRDGKWYLISRVNPKTIETVVRCVENVQDATGAIKPRVSFMLKKEDTYRLDELKTAAQVKVEHPELLAEWQELLAMRARIAARKAERALATQV